MNNKHIHIPTYDVLRFGFHTVGYLKEVARHGGTLSHKDQEFIENLRKEADSFGMDSEYRNLLEKNGKRMAQRLLKVEEEL